jgi:uncharacterized protein YndB with AHSA1/START domain
MEHEHTEHVAATPDRLFAALADVDNLPHYVPQLTTARHAQGDHVQVEARYEGRTKHGEAWFRTDADARRIEWGAEGSGYHGSLRIDPDGEGSRLTLFLSTVQGDAPDREVAGTLEAIRRLVEADI